MAETNNRLRRVTTAASAVVLTLVVLAAFVVPDGGAHWRALEQWTARQTMAFAARDFARPVLWGEPRPGDGGQHYARAEDLAERHLAAGDGGPLVTLWQGAAGGGRALPAAEAAALRERWAEAVAAMRAGARCAGARPRVDVTRGFEAPLANLLAGRWLVNLAVLDARDHVAAGRGHEAVRVLLDAAAYGADFLDSPATVEQCIGIALVTIAADQGLSDEHLRRLDGGALDELAAGLAVLDQRLPAYPSRRGEVLLLANWLVRDGTGLAATVPWPTTWRHAFSRRAVAVEAWAFQRDLAAALDESAPRAWPQRRRWLERRLASAPSGNVLLGSVNAGFAASVDRMLLLARARLRLLRVAVTLHRGEPAPPPQDPFTGQPLDVAADADGGWTVRCAGAPGERPVQRRVEPRE